MSSPQARRRHRVQPGAATAARAALFLIILLFVLVSVGLVAVSPWALSIVNDNSSTIDWDRLSQIGQTYGAVSAMIAAVALLGVAASLVIQSREAKAAHKSAQRAHHADLLRMAMDDPLYMECWGPYVTGTFDAERQFSYVNLIVTQWHSEYEIGELSDALLRATAASVLASIPGRRYWEAVSSFWLDNYSGRRAKRFYLILDEVYREALKRPPSSPPAPVIDWFPGSPGDSRFSRWEWIIPAACGAAVTAVLYAICRRWSR